MDDVQKKLEGAKAVVFSTFENLDIKAEDELRKRLRQEGVTFEVFKKTLLKKVLSKQGVLADEIDAWKGTIGIAASTSDEVAPARILVKAGREMEGLGIQFGIVNAKVVSRSDVVALALLLSKLELLAHFVGMLAAPLSGFMNVLQGTQRSLVYVLNQIKDKK